MMINEISSAAIALLGLIGLLAVGLFPARALTLLKDLAAVRPRSQRTAACTALAVLVVAMGLFADAIVALRLFRCLTTPYCGPNLASGWIQLAWLGLAYVAFEVASLVLKWIARRASSQPR